MPVAISKSISIKDKDGHISILTETDQIAESTDITATCDSSRCASRHDGKTAELTWNIEAIKEKAEALPDDFFRLLSLVINPRSQEQKVFCSAGCVRDFLQYDYVAPLSPREEAVLQATNQQAELAKHRPKTNIIPFPVPKVEVAPLVPPVAINESVQEYATGAEACPVGEAGEPGPEGVEAEQAAPHVSIDTEGSEPKPFSENVAPFDPVEDVFIPREGA